ncbi:hypothetical protein sscle_14g098860 [Sclerotinia sclerotiorum 1980 UF-70]|uniref:Uncharacterized protein n=1 Tax=Sclerotinia sclerotiorum (strain ATCC 18683 / 1980 / Ss-1) TaxID=665079 RepID=A0A1D9QJK5_SCLS1|nr:hypothetical protein sscle_14g098860 [Sclerotinia sclerotiorum 1980 UF-70]
MLVELVLFHSSNSGSFSFADVYCKEDWRVDHHYGRIPNCHCPYDKPASNFRMIPGTRLGKSAASCSGHKLSLLPVSPPLACVLSINFSAIGVSLLHPGNHHSSPASYICSSEISEKSSQVITSPDSQLGPAMMKKDSE